MRELKFRAWDKNAKLMYPDVGILAQSYDSEARIGGDEIAYKWSLKRVVIMQFTGLKDKNGKEIYEGDIVRQKTGRSYTEIRVVEFRDGAFRFNEQKTPHASFVYTNKNTEVIGNIYENKELVK